MYLRRACRPRLFALLLFALTFPDTHNAFGVVVRYTFTANGAAYGTVDVRLYQTFMPVSTTNFLHYVQNNKWDGSFIHRSVPDFVVQGGGFFVPQDGIIKTLNPYELNPLQPVNTIAPIQDEPAVGLPRISNQRGTISYAKSGPNTATSQWFFNLGNNSGLDSTARPDGGFAAFGRVVGNGMSIIDEIAMLGRVNAGSPFGEVPVLDVNAALSQGNIFNKDVIVVQDVALLNIPDADYDLNGVVNANDLAKWKSTFGSLTDAYADGNGNAIVDGTDFLMWQRGKTAAVPAVAAVPEPAAWLSAVVFGGLGRRLLRTRRRQHSG